MLIKNLLVAISYYLGVWWIAHDFESYHDFVDLFVSESLVAL